MLEELPPFFLDLEQKVEPAKLAGILGCNVSWLYQCSQTNKVPGEVKNYSYLSWIRKYIDYYKNNTEAKVTKYKLEQEEKAKRFTNKDGENEGMPPLMAAKIKQEIRLNSAKEAQIWQKSAIERGEYISIAEMTELVEPFIMTIRTNLLELALQSEEAEKKVDDIMDTLYNLGIRLVERAEQEQKEIVQTILDREFNHEDISLSEGTEKLL